MSLDPHDIVATFDSASVLHASTVAALRRERFPHLGNPGAVAALARVGGRLPWPVLKQIYARIGGAEGIDPDTLGDVDMERVAASFADADSPSTSVSSCRISSGMGSGFGDAVRSTG